MEEEQKLSLRTGWSKERVERLRGVGIGGGDKWSLGVKGTENRREVSGRWEGWVFQETYCDSGLVTCGTPPEGRCV